MRAETCVVVVKWVSSLMPASPVRGHFATGTPGGTSKILSVREYPQQPHVLQYAQTLDLPPSAVNRQHDRARRVGHLQHRRASAADEIQLRLVGGRRTFRRRQLAVNVRQLALELLGLVGSAGAAELGDRFFSRGPLPNPARQPAPLAINGSTGAGNFASRPSSVCGRDSPV